MLRRYPASSNPDVPAILRVSNSPGAVAKDETFLKSYRAAQIRSYFFGDPLGGNGIALNPHSQSLAFSEVAVYRAVNPNASSMTADFLPGVDEDDDEYDPTPTGNGMGGKGFEKIEPGQSLLNAIAAIKFASAGADQAQIRDAAVMGFVYVAEVDETKKRIRFLAPHPGRWGDRVLVVGEWPTGVGDLVS